MRKKLLFVMNNMTCGGAEKSLLSLLQSIDYDKFEVDLFLFKHEGLFLNKIPPKVNLLEEPQYYTVFDMPIKKALVLSLRNMKLQLFASRVLSAILMRTEKNRARCEQRMWRYVSKAFPLLEKEYDAAIGYLEKSPIYYVIDKVNAKSKLGFIHSEYEAYGMDAVIDKPYFKQLDHLVTVSEECVRSLREMFPDIHSKIKLMHNIVTPRTIYTMADETTPLPFDNINIVSVGRLNRVKGFDLAIEACRFLQKEGIPIKWYIVGEGEDRQRLEHLIDEKGLQDTVILTGVQSNPYPYIKHCHIYVQTSLNEGRCLTITEAKILQKPIVSTNFRAIYDQITHKENGLIVEQDAESISNGIKELITNNELRQKLINNLKDESLDNESEVNKFYQWVG
ncbi:glycosyltransferase [Paenibacillus sp. GSMTC-2017]|uniref:glycosyltransferase n=1 Tax=Paenibacillus sp. GSMTC-2017 TaxID=2794350 RepID=UPI0018D76C8A|nr:glycosyltransferase [Paenibacillus sp. GSMTC-2017]MBH5317295.1 glycosyltransferase [Paenibacillus sp. GSMTC-2017]